MAIDKLMLVKNITFKHSTPYFYDKNEIAEQTNKELIGYKRYMIIVGEILNKLWSEIFLPITYISNLLPMLSFNSWFFI